MRLQFLFVLIVTCILQSLATGPVLAEQDPNGILAKRVGIWNAKVTIKVPQEMTFEGQEKIGWALEHNYLMGKGFYDDNGDGKKTEVINLMTYSEVHKRYYMWEFKANGDVQPVPMVGVWDSQKEELVLSAEYGKLGSGAGTLKFENDGSFTWNFEVKNKKGIVVFSLEGTQVKVNKEKSTAKQNKTK
jgi:hypothetical protein